MRCFPSFPRSAWERPTATLCVATVSERRDASSLGIYWNGGHPVAKCPVRDAERRRKGRSHAERGNEKLELLICFNFRWVVGGQTRACGRAQRQLFRRNDGGGGLGFHATAAAGASLGVAAQCSPATRKQISAGQGDRAQSQQDLPIHHESLHCRRSKQTADLERQARSKIGQRRHIDKRKNGPAPTVRFTLDHHQR